MQGLIQLSKKYTQEKLESTKEANAYFATKDVKDLLKETRSGTVPKWKQLEMDCERMEEEFIQIGKTYGAENKLSTKELTVEISEEMINSKFQSINQYLLIRLMWHLGQTENQFCTKTLEKWIRSLLSMEKIGKKEEYYLECLIEIWNSDSRQLIPIDILEEIILLEDPSNTYGALIKATSYLSDHPKAEVEQVLAKARNTKSYKEDEAYRDWID